MSKNQVMTLLASFGVKCAYEAAKQANGGKDIEAANGRKFSIPLFVEFLESEEKITTLPEMIALYLTFPKEHAFEEVARKREEKKNELAKISARFGF